MTHKVDKEVLKTWIIPLGRAACMDDRPYTLITPFRLPLHLRDYFPARQNFIFREDVEAPMMVLTSEYNAWKGTNERF